MTDALQGPSCHIGCSLQGTHSHPTRHLAWLQDGQTDRRTGGTSLMRGSLTHRRSTRTEIHFYSVFFRAKSDSQEKAWPSIFNTVSMRIKCIVVGLNVLFGLKIVKAANLLKSKHKRITFSNICATLWFSLRLLLLLIMKLWEKNNVPHV